MQKNETKKFNKSAYDTQYIKNHYKNITLKLKPKDYDIISEFCKDLQISRTEFMKNCALYAIDNGLIDDIRAYKSRED